MNRVPRSLLALILISGFFFFPSPTSADDSAQNEIQSNDSQINDLQKQIDQYQAQLNTLGTQHKTLQSAIQTLDVSRAKITAQIQVTQKKIADANLTLKSLGVQIADKQVSIDFSKQAVASSLRDISRTDDMPLIATVFSSDSLSDAWTAVDADAELNGALQTHTTDLSVAKADLSDRQTAVNAAKADLSTQSQTLTSQQKALDASKQQKQALLAQTQNDEATYQKLLAQAQAELASFTAFTAGGGALGTQTVCDSWGCYYNQRDSTWGSIPMNHTQYTILSAGCLLTSVAMVLTHYGFKGVTPATINANPANFAAYAPAFLLKTVHVAGATATRVATTIDATLSTGNPVIVGMKFNDGSTHFVVLVSGSGGSYVMRDPWTAGGKDIPFSSHYSLSSIYEIEKVVVS